MKGKKPHAAAAQEAWEEAGVIGKVGKKPLGRFEYEKLMPEGEAVPCSVDVYALLVETLENTWPECGQRERRWMKPEEASKLVAERKLAKLLDRFGADGNDPARMAKLAAA
jgi:8-oxo-dGTP pyrophosphatase MutT (NUDIX family)